jgi:hypothetical protein
MPSWKSRTPALKLLPAAFSCVALASLTTEAHSQQPPNLYAAKYVCGDPTGPVVTAGVVAPGRYFTSINVHNPNAQAIEFQKKFDIALPNENPDGKISAVVNASLKPDAAFEIECADILGHLDMKLPTFAKGFVMLRSAQPLDVVAVYTAAASATGPVVAFHTERVPKD